MLLSKLQESKCSQILIFIDACAVPLDEKLAGRALLAALNKEEFEEFVRSRDFQALFMSCSPGQKSFPSTILKHGIWTYHLLQALNGQAPEALMRREWLTDVSLRDYLRNAVEKFIREQTTITASQRPYASINASHTFEILRFQPAYADSSPVKLAARSILVSSTIRWESTGLSNATAWSLAIDPVNPQTMYAGTIGNGAFTSTDGGRSWTAVNLGPTVHRVTCLAIDPVNPQTIYAGSGSGIFEGSGGKSWNLVYATLGVNSLAINPLNPKIVYAGSAGVLRSNDGGAIWSPNNWSNSGGGVYWVNSLAINPVNSQIVYAGSAGGGVSMSINGGQSWTAFNSGLTSLGIYCLAINPVNPQIIYAGTSDGFFMSTNGGTSWNALIQPTQSNQNYALAINPVNPQIVYAGNFGAGIFMSTDGGANWNAVLSGLTTLGINCLAVAPDTQIVYAGTDKGVFMNTCAAT